MINGRPTNSKPKAPEINIYSACSIFPDPDNGIEVLFDGEIGVHLMDG